MKKLLKFIKDNPLIFISIVYILLLVSLSLLAPYIAPDPKKIDTNNILQSPNHIHIFGTDALGRDYFARCLYGARVSLVIAFFSVFTALTIGVFIGLVSGYFGGIIDEVLMRFIDLISSIPSIILISAINAFLKPGLKSIIFVLGGFSWMGIARMVRAETLIYKEMDYVKYSKHIGAKPREIIFLHILPNILPIIITASSIGIGGSMLAESSLSFLGLGVQEPNSSWGSLVQDSQSYIRKAPYMSIIPGLLIFCTVHSFTKIGEFINKKTGAYYG